MQLLVLFCLLAALSVSAFTRPLTPTRLHSARPTQQAKGRGLQMIELEANTATYAAMFVATIIPSLAFVKFVGDQADSSRGSLSKETQDRFKRSMMEQPGANLSCPTSEEEALKKQIAKAYMQDKDVDVAVLEEKLRKRAQWRKEMMAQAKNQAANEVDEDGW